MESEGLMENRLKVALQAAVSAGKSIMEIYKRPFEVEHKEDQTPVTAADLAANSIILNYLEPTGIPIISEESAAAPFSIRQKWQACWIVDPLDGTREFVSRNGDFTVNIAHCERGRPILGVIFIPVTGILYYGDTQAGKAFKIPIGPDFVLPENVGDTLTEIRYATSVSGRLRVAASRSHMNTQTRDYIASLEGEYGKIDLISRGSSLKFCMLAEGKADRYPRFGPTMEWDTAAGHAIALASGLRVLEWPSGKPLEYNKESLRNPDFMVMP